MFSTRNPLEYRNTMVNIISVGTYFCSQTLLTFIIFRFDDILKSQKLKIQFSSPLLSKRTLPLLYGIIGA
jgi:hypothetical protein